MKTSDCWHVFAHNQTPFYEIVRVRCTTYGYWPRSTCLYLVSMGLTMLCPICCSHFGEYSIKFKYIFHGELGESWAILFVIYIYTKITTGKMVLIFFARFKCKHRKPMPMCFNVVEAEVWCLESQLCH